MSELHRYATSDDLVEGAARALVDAIVSFQVGGRVAVLGLTGGRIANRLYERLGALLGASDVDPGRLELWWSDENFVTTDDPRRNAGHALALLAGHFALDPARTHPMPSADGVADNAASAATYAKELGDVTFDICLMGLGADGHVASIFPDHPSFEPTSHRVIAVQAPDEPEQRISMSAEALCSSTEVWFLVTGPEKAAALASAVAGDRTLPAGVVRGVQSTLFFVDAAASADVPYYDCEF